jgi:hypothetical protein
MKGVTTAATVFFNVVGAAKMIFVNFSEPENTLAPTPPPIPCFSSFISFFRFAVLWTSLFYIISLFFP